MAITKEEVISQINVDEFGNIGVRKSTRIMEDGVMLSETYHRHVVEPGDDLFGQDAKIKAIGQVVHTPQVVAAAQARRAAQSIK